MRLSLEVFIPQAPDLEEFRCVRTVKEQGAEVLCDW